jgi:hypothetical protein
MGIAEWARAELSHATKRALPLVRDCFVAVLAPLESAREEALPAEKGSRPRVTVVVRSHDPIRIGLVLQQLASQTYDADRLDAIVLHPAQDPLSLDPPPPIGLGVATLSHPDAYGPSGANAALREATGDIVGFTDDFCTIPQGWVESAALAMTGWTAAITGRVIIDRGSAAPFLTLPCSRPTENEEHLFPTANSFFSRRALLDVGGFDEGFRRSGRPVWGWDTAAAQRLEARGYATAFEESLYVFRRFPFPTRRDWVFEEFRLAADLPAATCRSPGLARAALHGALFASRRTMYFDLLVVSVAAAFATRRRFFVLGALPWLKAVSHFLDVWPPTEWPTSLRHLRGMTARHVVWLSGLVTGSLRSGRVVL